MQTRWQSLTIHQTLFPGRNVPFVEKLVTHCSTEKKDDTVANKLRKIGGKGNKEFTKEGSVSKRFVGSNQMNGK